MANTPDGKGWDLSLQTSKSPGNGFPEGQIHQTDRPGMFHLKHVKQLKMDYPKGAYTRQNGAGIFDRYIYIYIYIYVSVYMYVYTSGGATL